MLIKFFHARPAGATPREKPLSEWTLGIAPVLTELLRSAHRALSAIRWKLYIGTLNLFCDVLFRWGSKLHIPGNFRAKVYWKAGRREIVPLPQLYDFFLQERPVGQFYPTAPKWSPRSQTILNELSPLIAKEDSILEIGCNMGRNLNHLWQAGYTNLRGMEISEHAVKRLRAEYPCLSTIPIEVGPAEQSILKHGGNSVDVILTMAVLEHLYPDCRYLFNEMARVVRRYVLAIESRHGKRSHMQYPWDIKSEFEAVGLVCIDVKPWSTLWAGELTSENEWHEDMHEYDAFLFSVN